MNPTGKTILIYGGTFDPPHRAHTTLPPIVARALGCPRMLYIPAATSPHKQNATSTPAHHRLAMLALALADIPEAEISTLELDRNGLSFTIDTLETLHQNAEPGNSFRLLIGADHALNFHAWKEWRRILQLAPPAVMLRPPLTIQSFHQQLIEVYGEKEALEWFDRAIPAPRFDISATDIRHRLAQNLPLEDLLDPAVLDYIHREHLYGV